MAGPWALKVLLLGAGIITLAYCQSAATIESTPARTGTESSVQNPTKLPLTASNITSRSSAQAVSGNDSLAIQSTPASTSRSTPFPTSNSTDPTTKQASTPRTTATTSPPTQITCSSNVIHNSTGFHIEVRSSAHGSATVEVIDQNTNKGVKEISFEVNRNNESVIQYLQPCHNYTYRVNFTANNRSIPCNKNNNSIQTMSIDKNDIKVTTGNRFVCYNTSWDLTSLLSSNGTSVTKHDNCTFCSKLSYNNTCSIVTVNVKKCNASNDSFQIIQNITLRDLNSNDIVMRPQNKFPVEIDIDLPQSCLSKVFTKNHTCWEKGSRNKTMDVSQLEPFKNYSCISHIKLDDNTTKDTAEYNLLINCYAELNCTPSARNDSICLHCTVINGNCSPKISYQCNCSAKGETNLEVADVHQQNGGCHLKSLKPYTNYTCHATPMYKNKTFGKAWNTTQQTDLGVPAASLKVNLAVINHNNIRLRCSKKKGDFHGPEMYKIKHYVTGNPEPAEGEILDICERTFPNLKYLTSYTVKVTSFNGEWEGPAIKSSIKTSYNAGAVIGFLIFLIIIVSMALIFVIFKIYVVRRMNSRDLSENMMLISTTHDEENLMPVEPIAADVLLDAYKRKLADEGRLFLAEFQSIPRIFSRYTVKEAKKPCNSPKNRYIDILPYDYNRVQLTTGNGEAGCDYINASFIDGYKESKKYIAAQGPKDETVTDFWRMIWEQQSSIIVMVTRCEEGNRVKCAQYWPSPERETELFGEFIVKLSSEDQYPDYTIRHLSLNNKREKNTDREVTHIQFMSWPDHGVPEEAQLLLKLRRRVNTFKNLFSGPIVVHCSAGVGRTGTYISIDAMMEGLEAEGRVDIYGYIVSLRRQRCLMVQVEAQYILIHQALLEQNQFGETEIPLPELHGTLSTLKQRSSADESSLMEDEFEALPNYRNWRTFNTGMTEENIRKNRSSSIIPYDYNRVVIKMEEGPSHDSDPDEDEEEESSDEEDEGSTKYINASHLNGYWGPRAFIAAQTPLPDTMADFWSMVYQKRVSNIIMLSDCDSEDEVPSDCGYWGKDKKTFGDYEVALVSTDKSPAFIIRTMLIRHVKRKESRTVKHFQFLKWVGRELPETPQDLTDMIKEIKKSCDSKSQRNTPVLVHCKDGSSHTGLFCAMWNLLDSAYTESLVDVFQVVKTLRKERQGMVSSLEQYQFLYDTLESAFPVQNGDVKTAKRLSTNSIQIVNETKTADRPSEEPAEWPASANTIDQQGSAERAGDAASEGSTEELDEVSSESTPLEGNSNGPNVTVET